MGIIDEALGPDSSESPKRRVSIIDEALAPEPGILDRAGQSAVSVWDAAKGAVRSVTGPEPKASVPVGHLNAPTGIDLSPPPGMDPIQQDFDVQRYFLAKEKGQPTDNLERELVGRGWTIKTPAPPMQPTITDMPAPPAAPPADPWAYPTPTSFAEVKAAGVSAAAFPGDLLASAIAGLTGLTELATGGGLDAAGKTIEKTTEALSPTAAIQPLLSKETKQAQAAQMSTVGAMFPPGGVVGQGAEALGVDEKYTPLIEAGTNILAIGGPTAWHYVKPSVLKALGPDRLYNDPYVRPLGEVLREEVDGGRMSPRDAASIVTAVWQTGDKYGLVFRDPNWIGKVLGAESPYYAGAVRAKEPGKLGPGPGPEPTPGLPPGPEPPPGPPGIAAPTGPLPTVMPERFPMKEGVDYSREVPGPRMLNEAPGVGIWKQATGGRPGVVIRPNVPIKGKVGEAWVAPASELPPPPPPTAPPTPISPEAGPTPSPGEERRKTPQIGPRERRDQALRKMIDEMSQDELKNALRYDDLTGLKSKRSFVEEAGKSPVKVALDVNGMKWINDNIGHEVGDQVLTAVADAIHQVGGDGYRISGDEMALLSDDPKTAASTVNGVKEALQNAEITAILPDGTKQILKGLTVTHGIGGKLDEAFLKLNADKEAAVTRGERSAERGGRPPGLLQVPSKGNEIRGKAAEGAEKVAYTPEDLAQAAAKTKEVEEFLGKFPYNFGETKGFGELIQQRAIPEEIMEVGRISSDLESHQEIFKPRFERFLKGDKRVKPEAIERDRKRWKEYLARTIDEARAKGRELDLAALAQQDPSRAAVDELAKKAGVEYLGPTEGKNLKFLDPGTGLPFLVQHGGSITAELGKLRGAFPMVSAEKQAATRKQVEDTRVRYTEDRAAREAAQKKYEADQEKKKLEKESMAGAKVRIAAERFREAREKALAKKKEKAMNQTPIARVRKGGGIKWTEDIAGEIRTYASRKEGGKKALPLQMLFRRQDKNPEGYAKAMAWDKWIQTFQQDGTLPEEAGIGDLFDLLLENKPGKGAGADVGAKWAEENAPTEEHISKIEAEAKKHREAEAKAEEVKQKERAARLVEVDEERAAIQAEAAGEFNEPAVLEAGTSPKDTGEIAEAFMEATDAMESDDFQVTHIFDPPAKNEIVRLQDKVKRYVGEKGWMKPEEAKAEVEKWKANAARQGKERVNAGKVVLSLFDLTGEWARPWHEAGYDVFTFDIQNDPMEDINKFSAQFLNEDWGAFGGDIYAIISANPCTDFAVSGARHFAVKDANGKTVESVELVQQTLRTIEYLKPQVWAIENPVGRIEKLTGLPPWRLSFDPNHFGHPYTKKTLLWGRFNGDLPIAPVEPTEGSKMWAKFGGKSQATKNARAETPEGFAYAFFQANNFHDHKAMGIANKYDRLNPEVIKEALGAGLSEQDIGAVVDDHFYMDLDDAAAEKALREATKKAIEAQNTREVKGHYDRIRTTPSYKEAKKQLDSGFILSATRLQSAPYNLKPPAVAETVKALKDAGYVERDGMIGTEKDLAEFDAASKKAGKMPEGWKVDLPDLGYKGPKPGKAKQTEAKWPINSKALVPFEEKMVVGTIEAIGKVKGDLGSRVDGSDSQIGDVWVKMPPGLKLPEGAVDHLVFDPADLKIPWKKSDLPAKQDFSVGDEVQFFTTGKSALQEGWKFGIVQGIDTDTGKVLIKAHSNIAFPIRLVKRPMDAVKLPDVPAPTAEDRARIDEQFKAEEEKRAAKKPIFPGEKAEQQPFKLDTEEAPEAEAPLIPEVAGEQPELFPGQRAKIKLPEKPAPAPPPAGGLFAPKPKIEAPIENVTGPDKLKIDLQRKGAGHVGDMDYKLVTYGSEDSPAVERVIKGDRETIVGFSGNKFESRDQAIAWAVDDAKTRSAATGTEVKSKGHLEFIGDTEFYVREDGRLYRAPVSNPVMTDGYRSGRFEHEKRPDFNPVLEIHRSIERRRKDEGGSATLDFLLAPYTLGRDMVRQFAKALLPSAVSKKHLWAAEALAHRLGEMHHAGEWWDAISKPDSKQFVKLGVHDPRIPLEQNIGIKVMSDISVGRKLDPKFQSYADKRAKMLELKQKQAEAAGAPIQGIREHYFEGVWSPASRRAFNQAVTEAVGMMQRAGIKVPDSVQGWSAADKAAVKARVKEIMAENGGTDSSAAMYLSNQPLKGKESFRKHKVFDDIMEGIEFGLEPVSNNPVDLDKIKFREIDKSIAINKFLRELESTGDIRFLSVFKKRSPQGFMRINDPYFTVYGPPEMAMSEFVDEHLYQGMLDIAASLGIKHERKMSAGPDRLGYAERFTGNIVTQYATEMTVLAHEISHQLDFKYDLWNEIVKKAEGMGKKGVVTKSASQKQRGLIMKQLRALADLKWEGQQPSKYYKDYTRKKVEQLAHLLEAYINAPGRFRDVAPDVYDAFHSFLASKPELAPFTKIRPGIALKELHNVKQIGGYPVIGHRIVSIPVGEIINNFLSQSAYQNPYFGIAFRGWMNVASTLNQTQLGMFSWFHAGFTSLEVQISGGAIALKDLYGIFKGNRTFGDFALSLAKAPASMVLTPRLGAKVLNEWLNPGTQSKRVQQIVRAAELAGFGWKMEGGLRTNQTVKMVKNWYSGQWEKAALRSPMALIELGAKPIMDFLVPRQKAGVFAELAGRIIDMNPGVPLEDLRPQFRAAAMRIDARLGQVRYDRLFIRRLAKNLIQALVRAPGWSGGTIAEIGGSLPDTVRFFKEWHEQKALPENLPDRVAYTTSLLIFTMTMGALLTYLFTGEDPTWEDMWAFRTGDTDINGKPERYVLPTYAKDLHAYYNNPTHTLLAKSHPLLSVLGDINRGYDYYQVKIRNKNDDPLTQIMDSLLFGTKQFTPFWIRGAQKGTEAAGGLVESLTNQPQKILAPLVGVMPATSAYTNSKAEAMMFEIGKERGRSIITKEKAEEKRLRAKALRLLRQGVNEGDMPADIQEGLEKLTPRQRQYIQSEAQISAFASRFKHLPSVNDKMDVWKIMTPEQREEVEALYDAALDRKRNELQGDPEALERFNDRVLKSE